MRHSVLVVGAALTVAALARGFFGAGAEEAAPRFEVDPAWPKPLPNRWLMGQAAGVAVDRRDHVWVVQRPRTLTDDERGAALTPAALALLRARAAGAWSSTPTASCSRPGADRRRLRLAGQRARDLRGPPGTCLARRQRPEGRPDPQVHARRQAS